MKISSKIPLFNLKKRNINIIKIDEVVYPVLECIESPKFPRLITEVCPFCNEIHYYWKSEIHTFFPIIVPSRCDKDIEIKVKYGRIISNENGYILELSNSINVTLYED